MKTIALYLIVATSAAGVPHQFTARITYYSSEEVGGRRTSTGCRPVEGVVVAVDPKIISYGQTIRIPALAGLVGDGEFVALDTGSAVKSRKAALAQGKDVPVIDVFLRSKDRVREVTRKLGKKGHFLTVTVL